MLKNSLFSLLCLAPFFCFNLFLSFFQRRTSSFFCFCFPCCCSAPALSFFSFGVLPFLFQPKILLFQAKRFSAQNVFASAQNFFLFFFFIFFQFSHSSLLLFFLLYSFLVQPSFFFLFQHFLFFLFFSSVYPRPNILSSCFTSLLFE